MNFYILSLLLAAFHLQSFREYLHDGIIFFRNICYLVFVCRSFVPLQKPPQKGDEFSGPVHPQRLHSGEKLIFRRIFTLSLSLAHSRQDYSCFVEMSWSWRNLNIYILLYVVGSSSALFLVDYVLEERWSFGCVVCCLRPRGEVSWCELSEMNNFIIFQTWKWLFEFVKIFVLLSHRASPRLMTKLF